MALKNPAQIAEMRPAGRFVAGVLSSLRDVARPGKTLKDLDAHAHRMIDAAGAHSVYLGYHPSFGAIPYPGVLCTSVNDAALHGLPSDHVLEDGDVLSIDFAAQVEGWVCDSALTFQLGTQTPEAQRLIATTEQALDAGIAAAR
ncbi:M24 family metallopeptidase, partial [Cellulomonas biazotea]